MKIGLLGTVGHTHGLIFYNESDFLDYYNHYIDPFKYNFWLIFHSIEEVERTCDVIWHIDSINQDQLEMLKL